MPTTQAFSKKEAVAAGALALTGPLIYGFSKLNPRKQKAIALGLASATFAAFSVIFAVMSCDCFARDYDGIGLFSALMSTTSGILSCQAAKEAHQALIQEYPPSEI